MPIETAAAARPGGGLSPPSSPAAVPWPSRRGLKLSQPVIAEPQTDGATSRPASPTTGKTADRGGTKVPAARTAGRAGGRATGDSAKPDGGDWNRLYFGAALSDDAGVAYTAVRLNGKDHPVSSFEPQKRKIRIRRTRYG